MRILLSKKSRKYLFEFLKQKYVVDTLPSLSHKLKIPYDTFKKWAYGDVYLPSSIIPSELTGLKVIDQREEGWGRKKGASIGGKRNVEIMKQRLGEKRYFEVRSKLGTKIMHSLWRKYGSNLTNRAISARIRIRERSASQLEEQHSSFFTNQIVTLNNSTISFSNADKKKNIQFPTEMTSELAEEIGIHLGDGCMSYNRNYFSVKCNKKEEDYMCGRLFYLYKTLYGVNLNLMRLPSVSGFEIYSKALCEFKNKILGIPRGEKVGRIRVPSVVLKTKNKSIYCSFIRGLFDTDGCIHLRYGKYPVISIGIHSEILMAQVGEMLKKMGFLPAVYDKAVILSGFTMLRKWLKYIGSNNPVKLRKLNWASSSVDKIIGCGPVDRGSIPRSLV